MQEIKPQSRLENWKHNFKETKTYVVLWAVFYALPKFLYILLYYRPMGKHLNQSRL